MIRAFCALLLAGLLAGCGGGGGGKTTTTTAAPPTSSTVPRAKHSFPPTMLKQDASDVSNAAIISLKLLDLPTGWRATYTTASNQPRLDMEDEVLVNCLFGEKPSPISAYYVSDLFVSPDLSLTMRSFVRVTASKTNAAADFANFTSARIASCQDSMYDWENNLPEGVTEIVGKKFGKAAPIAMPVDKLLLSDDSTNALAFRMIITPTDAVPTHQDIIGFGAGRYETVVVVQGNVVPDVSMETKAFSKVRERALAAARLG